MKQIILAAILALSLTACYRDSAKHRTPTESLLYLGWKASKTWQSTTSYTPLYPGIRFIFGRGEVRAVADPNGYIMETGSFEANTQRIITINFPVPSAYEELNGSWTVYKFDESHLLITSQTDPSKKLLLVGG